MRSPGMFDRILKCSSYGLTAAAFVLLCLGSWKFVSARAPKQPALIVSESPMKALGDVAPRSVMYVSFPVENRSDKPIRVVGSIKCCLKEGCLSAEGLPQTIAGHSSASVRLRLATTRGGDFQNSIVLYTDSVNQPQFTLGVTGHLLPVPTS